MLEIYIGEREYRREEELLLLYEDLCDTLNPRYHILYDLSH